MTTGFELVETELSWVEENIETADPAHVYARILRAINYHNSIAPSSVEEMGTKNLNKKVIREALRILGYGYLAAGKPVPVAQAATAMSFEAQSKREGKLPKQRVVFSGSRNYTDRALVARVLCTMDPQTTLIVHGACKTGLDAIVDTLARAAHFRVKAVPANWIKFRAQAGPVRNRQMLDAWEPHRVYVFYSNTEHKSAGTNGCAIEAEKRGILVFQAHKMFGD